MKRLFVLVFGFVLLLPGVVGARQGAQVRPDFEGFEGSAYLSEPVYGFLGSVELDAVYAEVLADGVESCPEWFAVALMTGWAPVEVPRLLRIVHRESRCIATACGETDSPHLRKCRDWGLLQINDYSWKSTVRRLGLDIEQMWDPFWNLWFGRWLFEYSVERNGDGWVPWKKR